MAERGVGTAAVSRRDVEAAADRIAGWVRHTPLERQATLSRLCGEEIYVKLENLQKTGSFKIRGALNKLLTLSEAERRRGVIAASAGNHAQGVAYAALRTNSRAVIVMPRGAAVSKIAATKEYGAEVVLAGETYDDAEAHARALAAERGLTFV
ncbi:MAG TPA: pyridoxal-phosphate dependent enzyme, partial [Limnochordia bacterium]